MKVLYARVSTVEQNTDRQTVNSDFEKVFIDKMSGKSMERPQLQAMLDFIREGDEVVVHSMDRLARNVKDLLTLVDQIKDKGASLHFEKEHMDFFPKQKETPMQTLMMTMLGAIAEFERNLILERQREGIAIAKEKGAYKGSKKKLTPSQIEELNKIYLKKEISVSELGKKFGISRKSVYNYLNNFLNQE